MRESERVRERLCMGESDSVREREGVRGIARGRGEKMSERESERVYV